MRYTRVGLVIAMLLAGWLGAQRETLFELPRDQSLDDVGLTPGALVMGAPSGVSLASIVHDF